MLELLAGLALVQSSLPANAGAAPGYRQESLAAFVAVENRRPLDGIDYSNGDGVLSAGLVYGHPGGFFAGAELLASHGDGVSLPDDDVLVSRGFAGYARNFGGQRMAIELLDYRLDADAYGRFDHQGIGWRYRRGGLEIEVAHERERPYYYRYLQRFFFYDNDRLAIGWHGGFGHGTGWMLSAGVSRIDVVDVRYPFVTGSLRGRLNGVDWQVGFSHAMDDVEDLYGGGLDRSHFVLRASLPFRWSWQ